VNFLHDNLLLLVNPEGTPIDRHEYATFNSSEESMTAQAIREKIRQWRHGNLRELRTSQANLTHIIYSMEHDPSLNAETTKISSLKEMLQSIERQITSGRRFPNFP
jgi:hypothetical protein